MINTSMWKKFPINELFNLSLSKDDIQPKNIIDGNVPLISSGKTNNGIIAYIQNDNATIQKANTITVDMFGKAFYQDENYYAVSHGRVNILSPKFNMTKYQGLFLACVIEQVSSKKYEFNEMCTGTKLSKDEIYLPITDDKKIDFDYMENYIKSIIKESEENLKKIKNINPKKHLIDISNWGNFSCKKIFECKNTGNILVRNIQDGSGDVPYVTASSYNNGVFGYIDASEYDIIKGHCILVGGKTFTVTYQKEDFVSNDSHNFVIRVKNYNISDLTYLFLVTEIHSYFSQKYSWNDAITKDKFLNETLPLPQTILGEPDWEYMENYMKKIMNKSEQIISDLQK